MRVLVSKVLKPILLLGGIQVFLILIMGIYSIKILAVIWFPLFVLPFALLYLLLSQNTLGGEYSTESQNRFRSPKVIWFVFFVGYLALYAPLRYTHVYVHRTSIDFCGPKKVQCTKHRVQISSMWNTTGFHEILTSPFILSFAYYPLKTVEEWYWRVIELLAPLNSSR